jgi:hypothetical protein
VIYGEALAEIAWPPLALVTACGSGRGALRLGDPGATDLTGPLLRAGVSAVIVSSGDIPYAATLAASGRIHDAIAAGESPAAALRRATAGDPALRSALVVHGLAHRPLFAPRRGDGLPVALVALVGILLLRRVIGRLAGRAAARANG